MKNRRVFRALIAVVAIAGGAVVIPGSPLYLPKLMNPGPLYEGRSKGYWIGELNSADPKIRITAIKAMGEFGHEAEEAAPTLSKILVEDGDRAVRNEAALSLSKMAVPAAVPALAQALEDKEPIIRINACRALSILKTKARSALPALVKAMMEEDNQTNANTFTFTIQEIAALAVGRVSAGTADGVPDLMSALAAARTREMRSAVARALGEVGPEARLAAPQLRKLLKDQNKELRRIAEEALSSIGVDPKDDKDEPKVAGKAETTELPQEELAYLWDIEHHGNLLVKHGFATFAASLKNADAAALSRILAEDFAGAEPREPKKLRSATTFANIERQQDAGNAPMPLTRDAFVARMLEFRKIFIDTPPQVKFALMTLAPKRRGQIDGSWEGTAQLRLHGERTKGAPAEVVIHLRFVVPRPSKETFAQTGWLRSAGMLQIQTAKAPQYLFAEVSKERGLRTAELYDNWKTSGFIPVTGGVYVCDFDRDGILDVLVTDINQSALYRGLPGGHFEDVTERVGLPRVSVRSGATVWVDIDGDGWDDLILAGRVYRNKEGKHFEDYMNHTNLSLPENASGVVVADYDRDGKLDLYVTRAGKPGENSWLDGQSGGAGGNYLFRNRGNWQFDDVTKASGTRGGYRSTFTAAWLDANNDGWPDLHAINEFGDGVLLINNRDGTFSSHSLADSPADFGSMGLAVGDIDNDGNIDIYCANMYSKAGTRVIGNLSPDAYPPRVMEKMRRFVGGSQLHRNKGNLKFEQAGKEMQVAAVGWAYGTCLADLDNDGFLDIYATAGYMSRDRNEPDG